MKALEKLDPTFLKNDSEVAAARKGLISILQENMAAPISKGFGIDLNLHPDTAPGIHATDNQGAVPDELVRIAQKYPDSPVAQKLLGRINQGPKK
jgi:hypothetical protein